MTEKHSRGDEAGAEWLNDRDELGEIKRHIAKSLFSDTMHDLFGRLKSTRKRVIAERQMRILEALLDAEMVVDALWLKAAHSYRGLRNPFRAFARDLAGLEALGAIDYDEERVAFSARMEWPAEITESKFFQRIEQLPKAKTRIF